MEDKKKAIFVVILLIAIIIIIFIFRKIQNQKYSKTNLSMNNIVSASDTQIDNEDIEKIKEDLYLDFKDALKISKEEYEKYGKINFDIYFGDRYISQNMNLGEVDYINIPLVDSRKPELIKIYDIAGNELENFPLDNTQYHDSNVISTNTEYLIKIIDNKSDYNLYYIIKINELGKANLKFICYTKGEERTVEEIENT